MSRKILIEEYLAKAQEAEGHSRSMSTPAVRESWLQMPEHYRMLAQVLVDGAEGNASESSLHSRLARRQSRVASLIPKMGLPISGLPFICSRQRSNSFRVAPPGARDALPCRCAYVAGQPKRLISARASNGARTLASLSK
jgi:hypothetical protein